MKLIIIGCCVIATVWKLKKGLKLGPTLQNQTKGVKIFVASYTNMSPSFMLILKRNNKNEKCKKMYFLICSNAYFSSSKKNYTLKAILWQKIVF